MTQLLRELLRDEGKEQRRGEQRQGAALHAVRSEGSEGTSAGPGRYGTGETLLRAGTVIKRWETLTWSSIKACLKVSSGFEALQ